MANSGMRKAVALRYDQQREGAPRVVASGRGEIAARILQVARQAEVPVYEDPALVEALSRLDLAAQIPAELYQIVAQVLVFVYAQDKAAWQPIAPR